MLTNSKQANRSLSADLIKTISIIGVVYIHSALLLGNNSAFHEHTASLFSFCVPCFIILWAYFLEKSYVKKSSAERRQYLKSRFIHLLIIFLIWSSIYFSLTADWDKLTLIKVITTYFSGYGWAGQYFFIILFQLILLYPVLSFCYKNRAIRFTLIILVTVIYFIWGYNSLSLPAVIGKLGDRPFFFWIPYVFTGIALARDEIKRLPVICILFVFLIPAEFHILKNLNLVHSAYITPGVVLASLVFCTALLQNLITVKRAWISNIIGYIGRNTMTIFVANPLVFIFLRLFIPENILPGLTIIESIFMSFASCFIILCFCLLVAEVIKKIKLDGIVN